MNTKTEVTNTVRRGIAATPPETLKRAANECDKYTFQKAGTGYFVCIHGDKAYVISDIDGEVGCGCGDMTHRCKDNEICKHLATYLKRSKVPSAKLDREIARDLMSAGWTGSEGELHPPREVVEGSAEEVPTPSESVDTTADLSKPAPPETPNPDYVAPTDSSEVPKPGTTEETEKPEPKQEEEDEDPEPKEYRCKICGTEYDTIDDALNCIEKCKARIKSKAPVNSAKTVRHKAMIKGISPQLQEIGRIAVGEKGGLSKSGATRLPTKLDHFIFTTLDKDEDDRYIRDQEMMDMFGDHCTEIPIRLLYNDIELNFPTFYAKYSRSGIKIRGDGENWTVYNADGTREEVFDPNNEHGFLNNKEVKPHGILTVLVEGQNSVGGVFKFRTTSWNSINNILSSLALIKNMCGMLTYIPLKLVYRKKEVTPIGMAHKTWIPVVSVEFRGSIEELQTQATEVQRLTSGTQRAEMQQIEAAVRDNLTEETSREQRDVADEFYPGVA